MMVKKLLKAIKQNFLYEQSNITFKMIVFGYKRLSKMLFQVKSRLLCKMLYNVFTISTYQN
ncbi:hypothetical protein J2K28_14030 [Staphylococcus aureus]|nr:hypothetical protein [Staphylococcus aureus]